MMHWIWIVIIGFLIGLVARWIKPGEIPGGIVATIILGILGSIVGGGIASLLGGVDGGVLGFVFGVIGALILIWLYGMVTQKH